MRRPASRLAFFLASITCCAGRGLSEPVQLAGGTGSLSSSTVQLVHPVTPYTHTSPAPQAGSCVAPSQRVQQVESSSASRARRPQLQRERRDPTRRCWCSGAERCETPSHAVRNPIKDLPLARVGVEQWGGWTCGSLSSRTDVRPCEWLLLQSHEERGES